MFWTNMLVWQLFINFQVFLHFNSIGNKHMCGGMNQYQSEAENGHEANSPHRRGGWKLSHLLLTAKWLTLAKQVVSADLSTGLRLECTQVLTIPWKGSLIRIPTTNGKRITCFFQIKFIWNCLDLNVWAHELWENTLPLLKFIQTWNH